MNPYYNNILVPVDNEANAEKAVAKAMNLVRHGRSTIHLIQLIPTWNPFGKLMPATAYNTGLKGALNKYIQTLLNLMRWKALIEKQGHVAQVRIHIMRGPSLNLFIQALALRMPIDLIIITGHKTIRWLPGAHTGPGDRIARQTQCAVLSLNSQKKRGVREVVEMLSEPYATAHHKKCGNDNARFGLTEVYGMLSDN
jgi:nucleotide-binding universal stress UspA family protein